MSNETELREDIPRKKATAVRCSGGTPPRKQLPSQALLYAAPSIRDLRKRNLEASSGEEEEVLRLEKKKKKKRKKKTHDRNDGLSGYEAYERSIILQIQSHRKECGECNCRRNILGRNQSTQTETVSTDRESQTYQSKSDAQYQTDMK